jgi:zinc D-Ala-D-Ala carboxypeptidase
MKERFIFISAVALPLFAGGLFLMNQSLSRTTEPGTSALVESAPLTYFNPEAVALESTTVAVGCPVGTQSLGTDPVPAHPLEASTLDPLLATRFAAAKAIAHSEGISLQLTSGFRSKEEQARLFADEVAKLGSEEEASKWVLPPVISHHPQGTAIDVNYNFDRPSTMWLEINGYKFGLCRAYANEWWHFEALTSPGVKCPAMKVDASVDVAQYESANS